MCAHNSNGTVDFATVRESLQDILRAAVLLVEVEEKYRLSKPFDLASYYFEVCPKVIRLNRMVKRLEGLK